ncbi:hypothetical protein CNMCM6069_006745 [Aspergillus lentulus]|nr:hypothetical protein CNMCM6069_006745 [Aspergillus lentulus]
MVIGLSQILGLYQFPLFERNSSEFKHQYDILQGRLYDGRNRHMTALEFVADIGTVETPVEGELLKWFNLAEAWNAVLLVDEADIFFERRQDRDLARNGWVSAFLRRMEYFKGLLFLTTNRVGQIEDAFISRVHIAIGYPSLGEEARRKAWNGFFRKPVRDRAGKIQIAPRREGMGSGDRRRDAAQRAGYPQCITNGYHTGRA